MKIVVLGVGNELRGDDSAGLKVARILNDDKGGAEDDREQDGTHIRDNKEEGKNANGKERRIEAYDCGPMPENFTQKALASGADTVLIVDAADMGLDPGRIRIIEKDSIIMETITTHALPLRFLIEYLEREGMDVHMIGIQPESIDMGSEMSPPVRKAIERTVALITEEDWTGLERV